MYLSLISHWRVPEVFAENKKGHSRAEVLFYFLGQQRKLGTKFTIVACARLFIFSTLRLSGMKLKRRFVVLLRGYLS